MFRIDEGERVGLGSVVPALLGPVQPAVCRLVDVRSHDPSRGRVDEADVAEAFTGRPDTCPTGTAVGRAKDHTAAGELIAANRDRCLPVDRLEALERET